MAGSEKILSLIKSQVHLVVPDAKVLLFGSRAYGIPTVESDWDILILTEQPVNSAIKKDIYKSLFPLSVKIGAFINALAVQETEWLNNPSYYSLQQTIKRGMVQA
jgi:predicted nucleotidyltransferase